MNTINTIAPCGMNCALCYAFQDRKKPCSGCRSKMAEVRKNCRNCLILSCDKKEYYCFECSIFPCRRFKSLDARYRIKYGMSMLENLIFIKEKGEKHFQIAQNQKYTCLDCGNLRTVHYKYCFNCKQENNHINK